MFCIINSFNKTAWKGADIFLLLVAFIYGCVCAICDVYATCEGQHLVSFSTNLYSMRPRTELARLTSQQDPGVLLSTLLHPGKSWLQQHTHQILALDRSRQGSWGLLANQPRVIGEFQVNERVSKWQGGQLLRNDTESCFLSCIFTLYGDWHRLSAVLQLCLSYNHDTFQHGNRVCWHHLTFNCCLACRK